MANVYSTYLTAVRKWENGIILRFSHPADRPPPIGMTGYGLGEPWVTKDSVRGIVKALTAGAGVRTTAEIQRVPVDVILDEGGQVMSIVFHLTQLYVSFSDYCRP